MSTATAMNGFGMTLGDYEPVTADVRNVLHLVWKNRLSYLQGSAIDWHPTITAAIDEIRANCGADNWDGEDAYAVTDATIKRTEKIVLALFSMLPKGTPAPDLVPEADGEIGISWNVEAGFVFSLSVGQHDKINFAGQLGKEIGGRHGWIPFDADNSQTDNPVLEEIVKYIGKLYPAIAGQRVARRAGH